MYSLSYDYLLYTNNLQVRVIYIFLLQWRKQHLIQRSKYCNSATCTAATACTYHKNVQNRGELKISKWNVWRIFEKKKHVKLREKKPLKRRAEGDYLNFYPHPPPPWWAKSTQNHICTVFKVYMKWKSSLSYLKELLKW